ncbi:hypothetical protein IF1G_00722 [Cordyceps javanica]|uniref:Secreted protein n=1 Tax=Cordyceps javanica TaxID=43265 RepID=A0A545VGF4_9HYPO|nr:hypothetical protein IF1G_00722 [Cordyceps javanica]
MAKLFLDFFLFCGIGRCVLFFQVDLESIRTSEAAGDHVQKQHGKIISGFWRFGTGADGERIASFLFFQFLPDLYGGVTNILRTSFWQSLDRRIDGLCRSSYPFDSL